MRGCKPASIFLCGLTVVDRPGGCVSTTKRSRFLKHNLNTRRDSLCNRLACNGGERLGDAEDDLFQQYLSLCAGEYECRSPRLFVTQDAHPKTDEDIVMLVDIFSGGGSFR
jgi:hypothetical protein